MGVGLGLCLMKNHIYLCLIATSFVAFSSCLKKQNLDDSNLGPAINSDELLSKMSDSIGSYSWALVNKNEISSFTSISVIEENQVTKIYKQDLFVTDVVDTADSLTIDFLFNKQDYLNSQNSINSRPYGIIFTKEEGLIRQNITLSAVAAKNIKTQAEEPKPFFLNRAYEYFALQGCREENVTCHNLTTEASKMYLRPELASAKVCPDVNSCIIDIKKIRFDMLDGSVTTSDGKPVRTHLTFIVSPQLPFLSKVMKYCQRGLVEYNNRKILQENCLSVDSFSYGQED